MGGAGLLTDQYELSMVNAARISGIAAKECVFEVYSRALPPGRPFGVFAGLERLLEKIENFSFADDEITWLREKNIVDNETLDWLRGYSFSGSISGHKEGEIFFPNTPVLTVRAPFAEAVVLETLILSCINFDSAIASAAAQLVYRAKNKPVYEMGSRRTNEQAAVAAARAAYIAGFAATSNLAAGKIWDIPTVGTMGHAFILAHKTESEAFYAQLKQGGGNNITLLIDTYDIQEAIDSAVTVAGKNLAAVRIDSGNLPEVVHDVRRKLDLAGATETKIILTGDLDEASIRLVSTAPVDALGVGTSLVTAGGFPSAGFVHKPVACREKNRWRMLSKKSKNKVSTGGQKNVQRVLDKNKKIIKEQVLVFDPDNPPVTTYDTNVLQITSEHIRHGKRVAINSTNEIRAYHKSVINQIPEEVFNLEGKINTERISWHSVQGHRLEA
ncbi:nicotinate phosphoribosyltransferase [Tropheryma whipplei]|uniref:Nicotinate phosphoribosyltransferase n=1 Tax=Tropheryma whipplei (strain Twist) TaxID=203267 RepID=Q83FT0_TROWT|nr:nicotinate phosphoribosyltransferase [Tropheryma whipplei]AAO44720.1 unknown [Tropheryma whipplei str. Twist]